MSLVAGVDVGNSTTEIVVADSSTSPPVVVATERASTRGRKGSAESGRAAAALLRRLTRTHALSVETVFVTPQRPVHTERLELPEVPVDLGPLLALTIGATTPAGTGVAFGRPVSIDSNLSDVPLDEPLVVVCSDPLGYRATAARVNELLASGRRIVALLLAGDEANLVAARLAQALPIVDGVDAAACLSCLRVAVEVAPAGDQVRELADPIRVANALGLPPADHLHAQAAASMTRGHRSAVIGVGHAQRPSVAHVESGTVTLIDGREVELSSVARAHLPPGAVRVLKAPPATATRVDDLWLVDLARLADGPGIRAGSIHDRALVAAALSDEQTEGEGIASFMQAWPGEVVPVTNEASAARLGALTTPGASLAAWVIDLGGGTVDVVPTVGAAVTAAGCGELLTASVRHALGISQGAAEWVKRGPASRIEAPHVISDESGERRFVTDAAPHGSVGWLVAGGPAGPLPFARELPLAEWRAIRLALKRRVFAENLDRILSSWGATDRPAEVVITGGPAGDDELVGLLNACLDGAVVGRAQVAGSLGHRWAVAYGLVVAGVRHLTTHM